MIDDRSETVVIHEDKVDYNELLTRMGVSTEQLDLSREQISEFTTVLRALATHPFNEADAEARELIGSHHFPLRRTLYSALIGTVAIGAAAVGAVFEPISGAAGIVAAVLGVTKDFSELIVKLTPEEIVVYEAIVHLQRKKTANKEKSRVSAPEIDQLFDERNAAGPDVEPILACLSKKNAIHSEFVDGAQRYWVER
jgi:hypothetical protein